jgi:hypothetical protein
LKDYYLLTYDNGVQYDGNDHYTIGVFDNYHLAVEFILMKGFKPGKTKDYYEKGKRYLCFYEETITIEKINLNGELNYYGEPLEEEEK